MMHLTVIYPISLILGIGESVVSGLFPLRLLPISSTPNWSTPILSTPTLSTVFIFKKVSKNHF